MSSFNLAELEGCFKHPSTKSTFATLPHCLGLVTAVASSPESITPSEWMKQLQADPDIPLGFSSEEQIQQITKNFVAWWDYCSTLFDQGQKITLPKKLDLTATAKANKALKDFCRGYLQGYNWLSKSWEELLPDSNTEEARSVSVLNMILIKIVDERALANVDQKLFQELPDIAGCFKTLPSLMSAVGMLGKDLAFELSENQDSKESFNRMPGPFRNANRNVGRNEDCPCGSGKKFKKCCLH